MKTVYFITSNTGKYREAKQRLEPLGYTVVQKNLGYPEIQALSLEDVAVFGVEDVSRRWDKPFFLEDAGLFIDALKGFPGVYSADVYKTIGLQGIIKLLEGIEQRTATFRSVIGFKGESGKMRLFIGECTGTIADVEVGTYGFGYDPIFIPTRSTQTFAQMQTNEKNRLSHRGKSLEQFISFLQK
jgi:XTP/dITP diphosphohydrolase